MEDLFGGGSPFSDFFGQIFGGMGGAAPRGGATRGGFEYQVRPQRGQDVEQEVEISLQEAYRGTTRMLQKDGRRLQVRIPAGARTGTRVRMAGEGGPGAAGGEAGDLYLRVRVAPDARFERQGDDLHASAPVDLYIAILGGKAEVPTLDGAVRLTIPPGTQNGQRFRLRAKGMPHLREPDEHGDLIVEVDVRLPTHLSPEQERLFGELQRISAQVSEETGG
jgi:curved DNA-binding protein